MNSSDGDYESLATLLAVAIAAFAKHTTHTTATYSYLSRTRTASHRLRQMSLMHETDGSEGEDVPPGVKRTRRFPWAHLQIIICVCSEILWSGELVGVRSRAIAVVDYFKKLF